MSSSIPLSILDLVPVAEGVTAAESVRQSIELAKLGDELGFVRLWYAEHHSMPSVASSSPEVLIAHAAALTRRLRVGSGGVMLPNHAPLRVAEAFRTLAALHPGRIDLGIGRAPGSDSTATRALRASDGEDFPQLLSEMLTWSGEADLPDDLPVKHPLRSLKAMPSDAPLPPIWILGSSGASARLAASAGMGYSFASHFSPTPAAPAFRAYREAFVPSDRFARPHTILGASVFCAPTLEEAEYHAAAMDLAWVRLRSGVYAPLPTAEQAAGRRYDEMEQRLVRQFRQIVVVGTPETVGRELKARVAAAEADELMIATNIADSVARLQSFRLVSEAMAS